MVVTPQVLQGTIETVGTPCQADWYFNNSTNDFSPPAARGVCSNPIKASHQGGNLQVVFNMIYLAPPTNMCSVFSNIVLVSSSAKQQKTWL